MKAIDKLREITSRLKDYGIETPEREAKILVERSLDIDTVGIYRDNPEFSEVQIRTLEVMLRRRLEHEPLQYILGCEEFLGLNLMVGVGVLIPRPETEFMAEQAVKAVTRQKVEDEKMRRYDDKKNSTSKLLTFSTSQIQDSSLSILDLCTGSGCLALALARAFPDADVYGIDISEIAIEYANKNAEINGIKNATFLKGNLFEPIEKRFTIHGSRFTADLIISNPPYIRTDDIKNLQPEIKSWEPVAALDGGLDGLDFYRELIPAATRFLKDNGLIMFELGYGQSSKVADIFKSSGYTLVEIIKDYTGIERIIKATWRR
jgi:release factor glutamine methyltransferase